MMPDFVNGVQLGSDARVKGLLHAVLAKGLWPDTSRFVACLVSVVGVIRGRPLAPKSRSDHPDRLVWEPQ